MYIIIDKLSGCVIQDYDAAIEQKLEAKEVYPKFNSAYMRLLSSDLSIEELSPYYDNLADHFHISKDGQLKPKTLTEKAAAKVISFDIEMIVQSSEFAAMTSGSKQLKIVTLALELGLLNSSHECQAALKMLKEDVLARIAKQYPPSKEIKIIKGYLQWISTGSKKGDDLEIAYTQMENDIAKINAEYKDTKDKIKKLESSLEENEQNIDINKEESS